MMILLLAGLAVFLLPAAREARAEGEAHWVWQGDHNASGTRYLRKEVQVEGPVKSAALVGTADNEIVAWVNGEEVFKGGNWQQLERSDLTSKLKPGKNVIALQAINGDGPGGVLAVLRIVTADGKTIQIGTDETWKIHSESVPNWNSADFDASGWETAQSLGLAGAEKLPWSKAITPQVIQETLDGAEKGSYVPVVADNVTPREGYVVERVFDVPRAMGSWVSLAKDPQGNLIASAQNGEGMFIVVPGQNGGATTVQKLPMDVSGAQGICWAFDSLYTVINGGQKSGLHRLKDTNGDGVLDSDEFLMPIPGGGEHGPHAVTLSPDGKSLFIVCGNHTKLPEGITASRIPQNWDEDHLLPRRWDANGHAAGILAPGGWIMKIDPEGKEREVVSIGYRNAYDIAFNADGELFSYDSDMEWDLGSPWYRPTRVTHSTSGSEFGWRSGTGKWPAYYEDSLPPALDVGPGSPVGVVFGAGTKFPAKYQKALFILDWTYSTIYAVHLTPEGSTYSGVKEEFLNGTPMQVTDAVIGDDGAMYFTAGGRGTKSALYRVRYTGPEATDPVELKNADGAQARALRQKLEAFHGKTDGNVNLFFAHLGDEDRFLRYAARVALEWQPVEKWRARALSGEGLSPRGAILALIALARQGSAEDLPGILNGLNKIDFSQLDEQGQLALLRAYELALIRQGQPSEEDRQKVIARLNPLYPAQAYPLNAELVQLLVSLNAPGVVSKTLALMDNLGPEPIPDWGYLTTRGDNYGGTVGKLLANMPPARAVHFAFVLRNQKEGWTIPEREKYFRFLIDAAKFPGGNSYSKFISQFREDALQNCSLSEKVAIGEIASVSLVAPPPQVTPPAGPGRKWTRDDALKVVEGNLSGQNFAKGRNLFFATSCGKCHRLNGEGGAIGPDLATAGKKFPLPDLLDSIIEPSKVISDQYASHQVLTTEGDTVVGRAVEIGDELHVFIPDAEAPPKVFKKDQIEAVQPSKISQMPVGLIDTLNPEELKDLLAYLISGADEKSEVYRKKK